MNTTRSSIPFQWWFIRQLQLPVKSPLLSLLNLFCGVRRHIESRTVRIHRERQHRDDQDYNCYSHTHQTLGAFVVFAQPVGASITMNTKEIGLQDVDPVFHRSARYEMKDRVL